MGRASRWGPCVAGLALAILLLAVGLVVSRPLPREWSHGLPVGLHPTVGGEILSPVASDTLQLYYHLWLAREGLRGSASLLHDPYQFAADGPRWSVPAGFWPLAVPFTVLSPLGTLRAYNLLVLLSFPLSGLAGFALVRRYTTDVAGAAAGGIAFALVPQRLHPLFEGHPAGFAAALVPVVLWGLDVAWRDGRRSGGVAGGTAFLALAMLEPHYLYFTAGLVLLYAAAWWGRRHRDPPRRPGAWLWLAGLAGGGVLWALLFRATLIAGSVVEGGRRLAEVQSHARGVAVLCDSGTYGGRMLPLLAIVGLLVPDGRVGPVRLFYGTIACAGLVLSLGPAGIVAPVYETLHRWLPFFALIRNLERFRFLTTLGLTVLAGWALCAIVRTMPPRLGRWAAVLLVGAVLVDVTPWRGITVMRIPDDPVHARIREEARRVVYVPVAAGDEVAGALPLYHATRTQVPMLNGYSPLAPSSYDARVVQPLLPLNAGDLGPAEHAHLRALGATHVVLDGAIPPASPFPIALTRARLAASGGLTWVAGGGPLWLFRLAEAYHAPRAALPTSAAGIFAPAGLLPRDTGHVVDDGGGPGRRSVAGRAGADRPGYLVSAWPLLLPRGGFRATVGARGGGLRLELLGQGVPSGRAQWELPVSDRWGEPAVVFALERAGPVTLRVHWDGRVDAAVEALDVAFADRPDPEWTFEAELLDHRLDAEPDPAASGGWTLRAAPERHRNLHVLEGPSRRFPAGEYVLSVRVQLDGPGAGAFLGLIVTEPWGPVVAERTVDARELAPDGYREATLTFSLPRARVLDFLVEYLGGPALRLDRLAVSRAAPR